MVRGEFRFFHCKHFVVVVFALDNSVDSFAIEDNDRVALYGVR